MTAPRPLPRWSPLLAVALGALWFGYVNISNAHAMSPTWGQDLAFFHQIVHSAANGGPWASPLLLEPQGFMAMVHTHLVLPLVIAVYAALPSQDTMLVVHAVFASLALWPAMRLGEACGGRLLGVAAPVSLALFGPFQGMAIADFRPSVLFCAGVLGVFAAARVRAPIGVLGWALVALVAREEAPYLLMASGLALCVLPWGAPEQGRWAARWWAGLRLREGLLLVAISLLAFGCWVWLKPSFFFHFDPMAPSLRPTLPPEVLADRLRFTGRLARSGFALGVLSPAGLLAGLPMFRELALDGREWHSLFGPSAHYPAFWLAFIAASGIAGAGRLGRVGAGLLVCGNLLAFWPVLPRSGPAHLRAVRDLVTPEDRVAADYTTIHALSGRAVLWNTEQFLMPESERPHGLDIPWPLSLDQVDVVVLPPEHALDERLSGFTEVGRVTGEDGQSRRVLRRIGGVP